MNTCDICGIEIPKKTDFILHAFTHIIEYNRNILHLHDTKEGYMKGFMDACRQWEITDKEIKKLRPQVEYLIEVNVKK